LAMKFGVVPTRLDRKVNRRNWRKPYWMGVTQWKNNQKSWLDWTKGLVPQFPSQKSTQPKHQQAHRRDTKVPRRNSGRDQTASRRNSPQR
jgi:hypothetical protein